MVEDISRPDIDGTPPKMAAISDAVKEALTGLLPYLKIACNDNLCSSVYIWGSLDAPETWTYNIFENSRYFVVKIMPPLRYYTPGDKVSVEISHKSGKIPKMRKYTAPPEKVVEYLKKWVLSLAS